VGVTKNRSWCRAFPAAAAAGAACVAALMCALPASAAHSGRTVHAARVAVTPEISANWAGYAITPVPPAAGTPPVTFTDATGTWVQPKATCQVGSTTSSAFWVGLGGFTESAQALEQLGTEADCGPRGAATYNAWFEIVPAPSVKVSMKIVPGDTVTAAVLVKGSQVTLSLRNVTRGTRFSKTLTPATPVDVSSAEWVAEAPSVCVASGSCLVLPLTNFGTVGFSKASATAGGHDGAISDPAWQATPMVLANAFDPSDSVGFKSRSSSSAAVPTDLSASGDAFDVTWQPSFDPGTTGG
jgi:hypothetical protein